MLKTVKDPPNTMDAGEKAPGGAASKASAPSWLNSAEKTSLKKFPE